MDVNQRNENGFYYDLLPLGGKFKTVLLDEIGAGWMFQFAHTKKLTDKDAPFKIDVLEVHLIKTNERIPIGYFSCKIFKRKSTHYIANEDFMCECDGISNSLYDFAYALTVTCQHIEIDDYFQQGSFAELTLFELRPPYCGHGLGVQIAKLFFNLLKQKCKVHSIFIQPFPLQYENAKPMQALYDADAKAQLKAHQAAFKKDLAKLTNWYKKKLNATVISKTSTRLEVNL